MPTSRVCKGTPKPAFWMDSTTCCGVEPLAARSIRARSAARLTLAATPGRRLSTFSMRAAHAAQVIPLSGRSRRWTDSVEVDAVGVADAVYRLDMIFRQLLRLNDQADC